MAVSCVGHSLLLTLTSHHSHHSHAAAQSGGALSAGLNVTYVRVQESRFGSNHAKVRCDSSSLSFVQRSDHYRWHFLQAVGGAVLLYMDGVFEIMRSTTFQANFATNSTDGTGIANLGGEVQCDTPCLSVCTTCASSPPTPQPTRPAAPTSHPAQVMPQPDGATGLSLELVLVLVLAISVGFVCTLGFGCIRMHRCTAEQTAPPTAEPFGFFELRSQLLRVENEPIEETLPCSSDWEYGSGLATDGRSAAPAPDSDDQPDDQSASNPGSRWDPAFVTPSASLRENGKTLEPQISVSTLSSSPAPIFVVNHSMRITLWSRGERRALGLRRVPGLSDHSSMVLLLGASDGVN